MPLAHHTRLGRYEIRTLLGEGGMGEVYRAYDPKLGRDVAVKVLPHAFSADPERLRRFEQEAQAAGRLNHPNILAIHDVDTQDGAPFVVSELLEGATLRELLSGDALPTRRAVDYALQIARGLAAAHERGIVHRDLKPENVFVTRDGRVKILDFGIAKLVEPDGGGEAHEDSPTRRLNTDPGAVVGTAGYMSPEQVRGRPVDYRSDIFSFGCVLYEMLTGRRAFRGDSAVETLNAILKEEPPELARADGQAAPALERVVRHCLEKSPEQRFRSAHDLAFALEALSGLGTTTGQSAPPSAIVGSRSKLRERLPWALAAAAVVAALAFALLYFRRAPVEARAVRFSVAPPERSDYRPALAVSPDGTKVAFSAVTNDGKVMLWVRPLDSFEAKALPGTENAGSSYFWSPDGRSVAFFTEDGKLKRIDVSGGPPLTLASVDSARGGAWSRDGDILLSAQAGPKATRYVLYRVRASGGEMTPVTDLDASRQETAHVYPHFLPDGRHFLYLAQSLEPGGSAIYAGSLDSKAPKRLLASEFRAAYAAPGYLLFVREGSLLAQPFRADRLELAGEPVAVARDVESYPDRGYAVFSASENGVLAYGSGSGALNSKLVWFDRGGKPLGQVGPVATYRHLSLAPDEKRVVFDRAEAQTNTRDVWLIDLTRGGASRLTFGPSRNVLPVWSPDGGRVVFGSERGGPRDIYQKLASGAGEEELLLKSPHDKNPTDWSRDGRFILYEERDPQTKADLWVLPTEVGRRPAPFLRSPSWEQQGVFSPDGRWVAYASYESGQFEVYVQSFPASGFKLQISNGGGADPRWLDDGKELFYIGNDKKLMSVEIKSEGGALEAGAPRPLFETQVLGLVDVRNHYVVTRDGQRFLFALPAHEGPASPFNVVLNWTAGLKN